MGSFIWEARKISRKTNISYSLIRTRTCVYQGVRNVSFSENFAYQLNEWSLYKNKNSSPSTPITFTPLSSPSKNVLKIFQTLSPSFKTTTWARVIPSSFLCTLYERLGMNWWSNNLGSGLSDVKWNWSKQSMRSQTDQTASISRKSVYNMFSIDLATVTQN